MDLENLHACDLLDSLQIGVVVHSRDTSIVYANRKGLEILHISSDQALGKKACDNEWRFLDKDGRRMQPEDYPVNQVIAHNAPLMEFQMGICNSSRPVIWVSCNAYPEVSTDGQTEHIVVNFIDITEQKNQILGIVAHDLRNPLYALITSFELVSELVGDQDPELLSIIESSLYTMNSIIDDLVESQKLNSAEIGLTKERLPLDELIHEVTRLNLQNADRKAIKLRIHTPKEITMSFDYNKLQRALDNLVNNAIKFSPHESEVTIGCEAIDSETIRIFVRDQGPGLTEQDQAKAFRAFQRLSAQPTAGEPSTGLGLSIVKKIAELHGGSAGVISEHPMGAEFYLDLPT